MTYSKPGTYQISFSVPYASGLVATIYRKVVVVPACAADEKLCSDGTCAPTSGMAEQNVVV
jgi:hypothetical protein